MGSIAKQLQAVPRLSCLPQLRVGTATVFGNYPLAWIAPHTSSLRAARGARWSALFSCGLGALGAATLLLNLAFDLTRRQSRWWLSGGLAATAWLSLSSHVGAQVLAFLVASLFPIVALLWGGLPLLWLDPQADSIAAIGQAGEAMRRESSGQRPSFVHALVAGCAVLLRTTFVTLLGAILIVALLNDWKFISKIDDFTGTKAAQLLPLAFTVLFFMSGLFPHMVIEQGAFSARLRLDQQVRQLLGATLTLRWVLLALIGSGVLLIWMTRTGNDSLVTVSAFEWQLRANFERIFIARPRSKEVFLAHPAMLWVAWLVLQRRLETDGVKLAPSSSVQVLCLLLVSLAAVGQIDLLNSFCQVNNPVAFAFVHTVIGTLLGAGYGVLTLVVYNLLMSHFRPVTATGQQIIPVASNPIETRLIVRRGVLYSGLALLAYGCFACGSVLWKRHVASRNLALTVFSAPAPLASWPWPQALQEEPHHGVRHWLDRSSPDGTTVELFDFDFAANPHLRLELYDQDERDAQPFDNQVAYWPNGVGKIAHTLNASGRGTVVAAWNGLFFGLKNRKPRLADRAFHVSPIVLHGQVYYASTVTNRRWTFGCQYRSGKPTFRVLFQPQSKLLAHSFDYAAGSAQCVLRNGVPLPLQASSIEAASLFSASGEPTRGVPSIMEAGSIPILDQIKTSRVSLGWTRDSQHLYLLFVKEPDSEVFSRRALARQQLGTGGWTLADVQRFWVAMKSARGVWNAINSDGGDVAQLLYQQADARYVLVPPRFALESGPAAQDPHAGTRRLLLSPTLQQTPPGGTIMSFYVRDTTSSKLNRKLPISAPGGH